MRNRNGHLISHMCTYCTIYGVQRHGIKTRAYNNCINRPHKYREFNLQSHKNYPEQIQLLQAKNVRCRCADSENVKNCPAIGNAIKRFQVIYGLCGLVPYRVPRSTVELSVASRHWVVYLPVVLCLSLSLYVCLSLYSAPPTTCLPAYHQILHLNAHSSK